MACRADLRRRLCCARLGWRHRHDRSGDRGHLLSARPIPGTDPAKRGRPDRACSEFSSGRAASGRAPPCLDHADPGRVDDRARARAVCATAAFPSRPAAADALGQSPRRLRHRPRPDRLLCDRSARRCRRCADASARALGLERLFPRRRTGRGRHAQRDRRTAFRLPPLPRELRARLYQRMAQHRFHALPTARRSGSWA